MTDDVTSERERHSVQGPGRADVGRAADADGGPEETARATRGEGERAGAPLRDSVRLVDIEVDVMVGPIGPIMICRENTRRDSRDLICLLAEPASQKALWALEMLCPPGLGDPTKSKVSSLEVVEVF